MGKPQKTTKQFIAEAKIKYGNKYDYSKTKYTTSHRKVIIICSIHGDFEQKAYSHTQGHGCPKCGGTGKLTTKEVIKRSKKTHGYKYNYKKCNYISDKHKIIITCFIHGEFQQRPINHMNGDGCPKCKADKIGNACRDTIPNFIKKAIEVHGDKYDYSTITDYINRFTHIEIGCKKHNWVFKQRPGDHLSGNGCKKCVSIGYSKSAIKWLDQISKKNNIFIIHAENKGEHSIQYKCKRTNTVKRIVVDGYHKESRTVYEYHGCYFHGHPPKHCLKKGYPSDQVNTKVKKTFGDLCKKTIRREKIIKSLGYTLITIWECQ
jgi:hypothetical protein